MKNSSVSNVGREEQSSWPVLFSYRIKITSTEINYLKPKFFNKLTLSLFFPQSVEKKFDLFIMFRSSNLFRRERRQKKKTSVYLFSRIMFGVQLKLYMCVTNLKNEIFESFYTRSWRGNADRIQTKTINLMLNGTTISEKYLKAEKSKKLEKKVQYSV